MAGLDSASGATLIDMAARAAAKHLFRDSEESAAKPLRELGALLSALKLVGGPSHAQAAQAAFASAIIGLRSASVPDARVAALAKMLAGHGVDLDAPDPAGARALHAMVREGRGAVCKALLDLGADPRAVDAAGLAEDQVERLGGERDGALSGLLRARREALELEEAAKEKSFWLVDLSVEGGQKVGATRVIRRQVLAFELAGGARDRWEGLDILAGPGDVGSISAKGPHAPVARQALCAEVFSLWKPLKAEGCSAQDVTVLEGRPGHSSFRMLGLQRVVVGVQDAAAVASQDVEGLARAFAAKAGARSWAVLELDRLGWEAWASIGRQGHQAAGAPQMLSSGELLSGFIRSALEAKELGSAAGAARAGRLGPRAL